MALLNAIWLSNTGCTVTAPIVRDSGASYDQGKKNSGALGYWTNEVGQQFLILTPHARGRFNGLVSTYGKRYPVPLTNDAGITPFTNGTFRIDAQHEVYFKEMNRWRKSDL